MSSSHKTPSARHWFFRLAAALDPRSAPRLARLLWGALLASGRRTVTAWIRAAGLQADFRPCYSTLAAAGRRAEGIAVRLLYGLLQPLLAGTDRLVFALDDTPTERYGPKVQGAGVHHNPSPGPCGSAFVYGHVWVVLALLVGHRAWGLLALPLLARLYIRRKDLDRLDAASRPPFRTKLELAVELLRWAVSWLKHLGKPLWVVADGAYAKAAFVRPLRDLGVTVVSRLRKDAALCSLPEPRRPGQRGPQRVYGTQRLNLAKRAGQRRGWSSGTFTLYGKEQVKRFKTFAATWRPAGGAIRVVLVDEPTGWVAFFCTDPQASVADVLEQMAARFSLETCFRDCKEIVGAGQQQVRRREANVGAFHVCLWTFTLTEVWAWEREEAELLAQRRASPWDVAERRPSHADKRRAWQWALWEEEIQAVVGEGAQAEQWQKLAERLLHLAP